MKPALVAAIILCLSVPARAAYEDEGLTEAAAPEAAAKMGEEEDGGALIQEEEEDLAAFVTDYISKDVQLKGAFLLEDKSAGKILKLRFVSIEPEFRAEKNGVMTVAARFRDDEGGKFTVLFRLKNGSWGGLDIFKIELKAAPAKTAPAAKKGN